MGTELEARLEELRQSILGCMKCPLCESRTRAVPGEGNLQAEIKTCAPYLVEQIELIGPKVVCPLGNMALHLFVEKSKVIHEVHGKPIPQDKFFLFPIYHSAAALRRPDLLPQVRADFTALKTFLDFEETLEPQPGQQSLF